MDNPPVNALDRRRLVRAGRHHHRRSGGAATCGSSCCGPRAVASTPASTSRRCRRPRASRPSSAPTAGCYAAFAAVYECEVPVIAAVHGYCLGGGIGLVGNADVIVATDDATFGLPEVDRGALGAATHLARLVPQHKMRAMVYTAATATAAGAARTTAACYAVVPRDRAARHGHGGRRRDRRQVADRHPRRQGEPQRHRPVGREAQLPLRAGLHLRAQPARASPTSTATRSSRSATRTRHDERTSSLTRGRRRRPAARRA